MYTNDVVAAARRWIAADPDPETRRELEDLLASDRIDEVTERMHGTLEFGTAGIRGVVGAGSAMMNRAVVIRTTAGLAAWLTVQGRRGPVVVGFDARLSSRRFAADTIGVLSAAGLVVRHFEHPVPTPVVAYAAMELGAAAAVVITASHNPPEYNGYKVYDDNGAQIIPPVDSEIADAIAAAPPASDVPRHEVDLDGDLAGSVAVPSGMFDRYLEDLEAVRRAEPARPGPVIVHTPLHGVGGAFIARALRRAGYERVHQVPAQVEPDGRFPTVRFPNPEEPGALDLAMELAGEVEAGLILANDPDVDRLAVALPTGDGSWRPLTGNQIGALLADYMLSGSAKSPTPLALSSIVSSPMLGSIAAAHGARWEQTLTGFKWIWNAALDLEESGAGRFVFGYEEALGYSVSRQVRDKDGISAAVVFADLAAECAAAGTTVWDRLFLLYRQHGLWVSEQKSVDRPGSEGQAEIAAAMERLAADVPARLGDREVTGFTDYATGAERRPRWLPATSLVALDLEGGSRVLVRPSGTEPKLKIYVDLRGDLGDSVDVAAAETRERTAARAIGEETARHIGLA